MRSLRTKRKLIEIMAAVDRCSCLLVPTQKNGIYYPRLGPQYRSSHQHNGIRHMRREYMVMYITILKKK